MIEYEVYVNSVHGSDVVTYDDFNQAVAEAYKWSKETDCDVVIEVVERNIGYRFSKGDLVFDYHKGEVLVSEMKYAKPCKDINEMNERYAEQIKRYKEIMEENK